MERIPIERFLELMTAHPCFDVRTPAEYENGHIPGAISLPLFTNEERAVIGTTYKRAGKEKAILEGLEFVGPRMRHLAESIRKESKKSGAALIHCWRGGMRSESVAWLAQFCGVETYVLEKGYKAYRAWCIEQFNTDRKIVILGGRTGSGKTEIIKAFRTAGEQSIDLEELACHKGSAYGSLGEAPQPHQEMFENLLATELSRTDPSRRLWLEDESLHIGRCVIPDAFWPKMREAHVVAVDIPLERRVKFLNDVYGAFDPALLAEMTKKIEKRFGPGRTKDCIDAIERGDIVEAVRISLEYYDKLYDYGLAKRPPDMISTFPFSDEPFEEIAKRLASLHPQE